MEVYILDSLYRRNLVFDRFESFIWTDRWSDVGDFELVIASTPVTRSVFVADVAVAQNESKRVMLVETIEDSTDIEGRKMLTVKGRSLEKILEDRVARYSTHNTELLPTWHINGLPIVIAEYLFSVVCVDGQLDVLDKIPLYAAGNAYPYTNLPPYPDSILWEQEPASLYSAIKDLCDTFAMGFRLYRNGDAGELFFNVYTGSDRTTKQDVFPPVIFSPGLETLQSTTRLTTVQPVKNVAYVVNEQGFQMVYADGVDPTVTGFNRRVLVVTPSKLQVDDGSGTMIDPTPTEISNYLIQQGKNELAQHQALFAFDGEINQYSPYRYGRDYELGDLVEMIDEDGVGNEMRVTEQIFVHDAEGERSYPTLTIKAHVVPGTWNSYLGNMEWDDFGATEYWNTQP